MISTLRIKLIKTRDFDRDVLFSTNFSAVFNAKFRELLSKLQIA